MRYEQLIISLCKCQCTNGFFQLRMESDDDSDAPDSIVPASSPESQLGDETTRFPHLLDPKEEEVERAISPVIPMIPRSAIPSMCHCLDMILISLLESFMID